MSFGTYVKGIDGLIAGATSGWLYDVNDKSAEVGADSYKLKSGDVVVFRFVSDWSNMSQETLQQTLDKFGTCKTVEEPKTDDPKQENQKNQRQMIQNKKNQKNQRRMIQNKKSQKNQKRMIQNKKSQKNRRRMIQNKKNQNNQSKKIFKFQQHK